MNAVPDMHASRTSAGYTLVELMIVITVVALAAAAAAPAFGTAIVDHRALTATRDVHRLGRQAYWGALRYHDAHVLSFTQMAGAGGTPGHVELLRGLNNSCDQNWAALRAAACCAAGCEDDQICIDWAHLEHSRYTRFGAGPVLTLQNGGGGATYALCYRADGTIETSTDLVSGFSANNTASGGLIFAVQTYDSDEGELEGIARRVLFPLGGMSRRLR